VDFQPLNRELAKSHGVEIPTRGGVVGLIVLSVHPRSPASRLGLEGGDILLSLREEEDPEPIELAARGEFGREDSFDDGLPDDMPEGLEGMSHNGPPWRSPRNSLTEKLTRIGEGRKVQLTYLRGGMEREAWITLEVAPPDFENSPKYKAEDLGLTVKDLTYEVRNHYRLKDDAPGVVVAKVEPGGKAAIAKVLPFEILISVNGQVVRTVDEFRRLLSGAGPPAPEERTLELKLERMGKSRLLRIRM
jgi:S1-C subfamily serine protease